MAPVSDSEPDLEPEASDGNFALLLKPLQDINKNWDIDISQLLDDYLEFIRRDKITSMNFCKAALVLSNSAGVYSRKIEYLAIVVEQLLNSLSIKHNLSPRGKDGNCTRRSRNDEQPGSEKAAATRRRRAVNLDGDSFEPLDNMCSDRSITIDVDKYQSDKQKQKVVLNAAIKVKPKENTTCNAYHCKEEPMGKKDEFRLNWRISSDGTLHEDFVVKKNRFEAMMPLEISTVAVVAENDQSHDMEPAPCSPVFTSSIQHHMSIECESEDRFREARLRKDTVKTVDVKELEWQPCDPNVNMPEKPIRKRKVLKMPPGLDEAAKQRYHLLKNHRAKYLAYLEKEAATPQLGDFNGFDDEEETNDDVFEGFNEGENGNANDVDAPLPNVEDIMDPHADDANWQGDYSQAAALTMAAFKARRIDHGAMTDMARRVEEWHQKITPKLEAAESRSSFDIHGYGTKVLDTFCGKIGSEKLFQDIVVGQSKEEVSRYFLSTLLLANQYNVEITKTDKDSDMAVDCIKLKLLSLVRHHEELDDNIRQTSSDK